MLEDNQYYLTTEALTSRALLEYCKHMPHDSSYGLVESKVRKWIISIYEKCDKPKKVVRLNENFFLRKRKAPTPLLKTLLTKKLAPFYETLHAIKEEIAAGLCGIYKNECINIKEQLDAQTFNPDDIITHYILPIKKDFLDAWPEQEVESFDNTFGLRLDKFYHTLISDLNALTQNESYEAIALL